MGWFQWSAVALYVAILLFGAVWVAVRYYGERRDQKGHRKTENRLENGTRQNGTGLPTP